MWVELYMIYYYENKIIVIVMYDIKFRKKKLGEVKLLSGGQMLNDRVLR